MPFKKFTVYVHITPNNKLYIGITSLRVNERWNSGYGYHNCKLFWRAIQKYGWDNIRHIILLENLSHEVACECERYLISKYQTNNVDFGYNLTSGGDGIVGYKFSKDHCHRQSERMKGHTVSEETRRKIGNANRVALKGRTLPDEVKTKLKGRQSPLKGTHLSEESKRKISEKQKGNKYHLGCKVSEESRRHMSEVHKGQQLSEYNKNALLQACANARNNPVKEQARREKIRQAHLGKKKKQWSEEAREAHRLANERRKQSKVMQTEGLYEART